MPVNTALANEVWNRYQYCRDNGHTDFMAKADTCDRFFCGDQWRAADLAELRQQRRPALTINKIMPTVGSVMGEQIKNRAEISFRPRSGAPAGNSVTLGKVLKQIADDNQLNWLRSQMFDDGVITSRGFIDVRLSFEKSMQGVVKYCNINPKNVVIDPDGEEMDPDTWSDVFVTKWVTADDIAVMYSQEDADLLKNRTDSSYPYGYDSITEDRDRFGNRTTPGYSDSSNPQGVARSIRMIDRQYKKLTKAKFFVNPKTGDMRPVPDEWDAARINLLKEKFGFEVISRVVRKIRWTVIADNVVLHDDWSPYEYFTVQPYFPYFRHGRTVGLVENLLGPQELLNKTTSQELHIVNSSANGGWKVKAGALANMSIEELEQRGAETGLVIEFAGDSKDIEKITPNQIPQGLDRLSYKAEESIKSISNVSDSALGQDRADVAAKAIQEKKQSGQITLVKPLDNLQRTDFFIARATVSLVQRYYTEQRVLTITHDAVKQTTEDITINAPDENGDILNDLTMGEYDIVVTSVPVKDTLEDSEFDQAVALKELGIAIPDEIIINASRLQDKKTILEKMAARSTSPEAQQQNQLALAEAQAQIEKLHAEIDKIKAETQAKAVSTEKEAATPIEAGDSGAAKMAEVDVKAQAAEQEAALKQQQHRDEMEFQYTKLDTDAQLAQKKQEDDKQTARIAAIMQPQAPAAPAGGSAPKPAKGK